MTKRKLTPHSALKRRSPAQIESPSQSRWKWHSTVAAAAIALTIFAYSNAVSGKFVYDDNLQIVKNQFIQHNQYIWQAMTSDVWAFKGEVGGARSNYWRPVFVLWLALNFKLFGLDPAGWHVLSILVHILATLLVYRLLVVLGLQPAVGAVVTWIFATHPIHVQSVAWISGVPDVLASVFLVGSFLFYIGTRERQRRAYLTLSLFLFALALLSKESAITFPGIVFLVDLNLTRDQRKLSKPVLALALRRSAPFLACSVTFLLLRYLVIHVVRSLAADPPGIATVLMTLPSILVFYLKQVVFPLELGPNYGLRYVNSGNIGLGNFLVPLVSIATLAYASYKLSHRNKAYGIGLALFLLPLLPVLDVRIFLPETLVQDRYLYLPALGLLIIMATGCFEIASLLAHGKTRIMQNGFCATGLAAALGLAIATRLYNPVWSDDLALWERAARVDPASAMVFSHLGSAYERAGRDAEARVALTRALEIKPDLTIANIGMGIVAIRQRRFDEAARYLKGVIDVYPDYDVARENLAVAYQEQGKYAEAITLLDEGRRLMPHKGASYTVNIAMLYKQAGFGVEAQAELESLIPQLPSATDAEVIKAWWYLGEIYREQRNAAAAMNAYEKYIAATAQIDDAKVTRIRELAFQALQRLKAAPR